MTQKQLITANNAELEKHKQDILSLPMADDVKNGKYVWGKYDKNFYVMNPTFKVKCVDYDSLVIMESNFDFSQIPNPLDFIVGFKSTDGKYSILKGVDGAYATNGRYQADLTSFDGTKFTGFSITSGCLADNEEVVFVYDGEKILSDKEKSFLSYTVSDSETAYPDGGEKDGFWWERVKQGLPITKMGFTKFTYGEFTLSVDNDTSFTIVHNLGAKLKKLIVYTEDSLVRKNYGIRQLSLVDRYTSYSGSGEEYYFQFGAYQQTSYSDREGFSTFESGIHRSDVTTSKVTLRLDTVNYLVGGKKYYWMAMA